MYLIACFALMAAGLCANALDRRMLALTALVGASIFLPTPAEYGAFYLYCVAAECLVAVVALWLRASASVVIAEVCVLLVITHAMGYSLDGSLPFSPYQMIIKLLEVAQLVVCIVLSPVVAPILRNDDAKTQ